MKLTHAGITTEEFGTVCRRWLASARHPRSGRPYPAMVYQPMLELLSLLDRSGFSCWIFSGGGTDFMRAFASEVYGLPPHRIIGSVGGTEFRGGPGGPELVKSAAIQVLNDGPQKPGSIHTHIGQRPILAAGNTDGDLAMLQWSGASPQRTLQLVVRHTDAEREYAYDRDPILGSGTGQILAAAKQHTWTVIDMAADWSTVHPPVPGRPQSDALRGCSHVLLTGSKSAPASCSQVAGGDRWLLMAVRGHLRDTRQ